jgi:hypothetical protein
MTDEELQKFAAMISAEPLGLAHYRPEPWALNGYCIANVWKKVELSGGRAIFGWTFQIKTRPEGEYLVATHHSVWCNPKGELVDVTRLHEIENNRPLRIDGDVVFQVDRQAQPIQENNKVLPLPLWYHTYSGDDSLAQYVAKLQRDEVTSWQALCDSEERPPNSIIL